MMVERVSQARADGSCEHESGAEQRQKHDADCESAASTATSTCDGGGGSRTLSMMLGDERSARAHGCRCCWWVDHHAARR